MKIDWKKVKSLALTYGALALPTATAAFAMNANATVKFLSFVSGLLPVVARQINPNDPFTCNLLHVAQLEVDAALEKQTKKGK